jgi:hypothetical protein
VTQPTLQNLGAQQQPSGALGQSGDLTPQSGAIGGSQVIGQPQIQQAQQQQQLAAITAAQEQSAQQDQQNQKDKSKGWSLSNPLQDIGQVWHDVETHTVSPAFHADNWVLQTLVKRPIATAALYAGHAGYEASQGHANWSLAQGSLWAQSWNASAHISMGRALVLAANDQGHVGPFTVQWSPSLDHQFVDPLNVQQRDAYLNDKSSPVHIGTQIASGGMDALADWFGDPANHITKVADTLRVMKNAPVLDSDSSAERIAKLNAPSSAKFDQAVPNMDFAQLAEHPIVKGTSDNANPLRYETAALLAAAKTPEESNLIRQVLAGIPDALNQVQNAAEVPGEVVSSSKSLDKLANQNQDLAAQVSNMLMPLEINEQYAMTASSEAERDDWLQKVNALKAKAAQANLNMDPDTAARVAKLFGMQRDITRSSAITNKLAELKGAGKYANIRDTSALHFIHNSMYAYPVRFYQSLTDRVPGLINHNQDNAVEYARTWLNKSSSLTPDEKIAYTQQYANASLGDRQRVWTNIENDVYNKVGQKYGLPSDQMQKILTTTRKKGQSIYMAAKSRAYGTLTVGKEDPAAILPSDDESVVLHPQLITQLEAGAMPLANLKQLENALDRMQDTGLLAPLRNAGAYAKDMLGYLMDNVYGIWKPLTLMTGHRVFNHVGDDFLRGVAKLGGLDTINNTVEGAGNFLRNNYARVNNNLIADNIMGKYQQSVGIAKANYDGLLAQYKTQRSWGINNIPEDIRITPAQLQEKKNIYNMLKQSPPAFINKSHRLGEGTFKIPGSNISWDEAFGGPNGDYQRYATSSHPTFMSTIDGASKMSHSTQMALRGKGFASLNAIDHPGQYERAYVHYIRNQMMPDPVAKQIVAGAPLDDVAKWMTSTSQGRSYMKALHVGDPDIKVNEIASMVKTYLPTDAMRDDAVRGKFNVDTITRAMPDAAQRPDIHANVAALVHGGDGPTNLFKKASDSLMHMTGTLPDDVVVRHPLYNSLYKNRLTSDVQSWINQTGRDVTDKATRDMLVSGAHLAAKKDLQNLVYDTSRFNDLGHTLRFVSPFFNAWFNALSSWSKLIMQNPGLLGRAYQAKRALWNSPFTIDNTTGQKANVNTPWDQTSFVFHMPKALAGSLGGLTDVPIDAKTLISPTYLDAIGNPGFGPLISIPANQIVLSHPELMNDAVVQSMLNNMVDKNSMQQLIPSGVNDAGTLATLISGHPGDSESYAKTVWSIYQEQYYDYLNGQRQTPPNWGDVQTQAKWLTAVDLVANRLSPLGFKPAPGHQFLIDEYHRMQSADPQNAQQDFYNKYGASGMVFTQSLSTDPTGISATVGASKAVNKYSGLLDQFPELGAAIVGPDGNGNYDQMAYDWQVARGLRQKLTPQQAATQEQVNLGWAEYGRLSAQAQSLIQARGLSSINDVNARDIKTQLTNFVSATGDPSPGNTLYNPAFYANYGSYNPNSYMTRIQALFTIAQDPALLANPARSDIRSLQAYSQIRDAVYAALQNRTSKSITAVGNEDIAGQYDTAVAQLMQKDSKFAQLYDRFLRKDDFKEPIQ